MPSVELYSYQIDAIENMHNGCILCAEVGLGKSRTAIAYYYEKVAGGSLVINGEGTYRKRKNPKKLYIITTAKKRDSLEWEHELIPFLIPEEDVVIDSWNNIKKYEKVYGAFFIFDEQRVVGKGTWVKAFLKIAKKNQWILLTATPGDSWSDYIPVFVANGFYKNRTEFTSIHVVYKPFMNYPVIDRYIGERVLSRYRDQILVEMTYEKLHKKVEHKIFVKYDREMYRSAYKSRWDPFDNEPITQAGKLCYILRKIVNSDQSRIDAVRVILKENPKAIIFYNFTYELNLLRALAKELKYDIGEWNGEVHSAVPITDRWVYLGQYSAASEGWNCITTNVVIFFSQSYSYKMTVQAAGRIDRVNTPFKELHFYRIRSNAPIDLAIASALAKKQDFNQSDYISKNLHTL